MKAGKDPPTKIIHSKAITGFDKTDFYGILSSYL